ncbi:dTMP kinase [Enemella dayhoffiae]|uniref:Thymidylate kinase n=1 Tax=Enemella dayhoffiae TaxID=2016507 RepID=A0A255H8R6_9ACTN|nr:dTMP kinase [Enemella dayhoffiae]OYO24130.1 dTMP kinase [Enemella dayhoffiae]
MTGWFVVFEGGDGAGKSTQVRRLVDWLTEQGHEVVLTREPGDTELGQQVRGIVLDPSTGEVDLRAEALLIAADKAQHLFQVVRPALERGAVVVCDRYVDSMIAYQGAGRGLGTERVRELADWATDGLRPDLTVLLDVDPDEAVHRKEVKDRLEGLGVEFHTRVRNAFVELAAAEPDRYLVLPARRSRDEISAAVTTRVDELVSVPPATLGR